MFKVLAKIWKMRWIFRSLLSSVYFNFRMLPVNQAWKLPILLYKPKLCSLKGKITVCGNIRFGMVRLGCFRVPLYPNNGIKIYVDGNLVFYGDCNIGNNSVLSVSESGSLSFGRFFSATAALKLTCSNEICFGEHVTVGWDNIFMDSDFHRLSKLNMGGYTKGYGKIEIGSDNWFACRNIILKNTLTPNKCTIAAQTVLNKDYRKFGEYVVIGNNNTVSVLAKDVWLDSNDPESRKIEIK